MSLAQVEEYRSQFAGVRDRSLWKGALGIPAVGRGRSSTPWCPPSRGLLPLRSRGPDWRNRPERSAVTPGCRLVSRAGVRESVFAADQVPRSSRRRGVYRFSPTRWHSATISSTPGRYGTP